MEAVSINTRSTKNKGNENCEMLKDLAPLKREADRSPEAIAKKRLVLGNITNNAKLVKVQGSLASIAKKHAKIIKLSTNSVSDDGGIKEIKPELSSPLLESCMELDGNQVFAMPTLPPGVDDFDKENISDPYSMSHHASHIFQYYKERERKFALKKYIKHQPEISKNMRAVLVDWMVEVQESFELNHETLYLAVKLVDMYLMEHKVSKCNLQLVGATAVLIACKYDERLPPLVDDFLYICDDSYSRSQILSMESNILTAIDFDLGIPLSYRFLRRYARCAKIPMDTLTLARYILETSLMDYELIDVLDSKIAAAALYLAMKMKTIHEWTPTLQYYSGYQMADFQDLVKELNKNISVQPNKSLRTIHTKYSHSVFFEVAKVPLVQIG